MGLRSEAAGHAGCPPPRGCRVGHVEPVLDNKAPVGYPLYVGVSGLRAPGNHRMEDLRTD